MGARPSSFAKPPEEPKVPERVWSPQQEDIFTWFKTGCIIPVDNYVPVQHLVVRARAGTGKTTTIIDGVQQAPETAILVAAFNKKIAQELTRRISGPEGKVEAMTLHSLGNRFIGREWRGMRVKDYKPGQLTRAEWLTEQVQGDNLPKPIRRLISELHTKVREMVPLTRTREDVMALALQFNLLPDQGWGKYNDGFVVDAAYEAVQFAVNTEPRYDVGIDFADMIFLPLVWNLLRPEFDMVVIDEAQDLTVAQLTMAQKVCSGRICVVGDDKQAIYGFRGADSGSIDRLKRELGATELPLTVTYRCGQSIVERAQTLVPDITADPSNSVGTIDTCLADDVVQLAAPGDFVLSRLNAPLVSLTLQLLGAGKRAHMVGREIGKSITRILWSLKAESTPLLELLTKLQNWESKRVTKAANFGDLDAVDRIQDQAGMIRAVAQDVETSRQLMQKVEFLFEDDPERDQVILSSVHKAKGLESSRCFVLRDTFYRRGRTQDEDNCMYVAITRAKTHLTFVN